MEGSETGGAWVGLWLGREDGGERDGRHVGGKGLGREDGGERDGRRVGGDETGEGRWRGARRELARENGGQRDGSPQASQASLQAALGQCKSRTNMGRHVGR